MTAFWGPNLEMAFASQNNLNSLFGSDGHNTGLQSNWALRVSDDLNLFSPKTSLSGFVLASMSVSGAANLLWFGRKWWKKLTNPRKLFNCVLFWGNFQFLIASDFSSLMHIFPCWTQTPRILTESDANTHFDIFAVNPVFCRHSNTSFKWIKCFPWRAVDD